MKVGDLVKYRKCPTKLKPPHIVNNSVGVIIRCIAGTDQVKVVQWLYENGPTCSYPAECLEVLCN